jgi:hypothetical protein
MTETTQGTAETPLGQRTLVERIVESVAARKGVDETAMPPLYDAVAVEGLESLFERAHDPADAALSVEFQYAGCGVSVDPDGTVTVE